MGNNLPSYLGHTGNVSTGSAQSRDSVNLGRLKVQDAKVSINGAQSSGASTSIFHAGMGGPKSANDDYEKNRLVALDRNRAMQAVKAREEKKAAAAAAQKPVDKDAFEVALGGGYKLKGRYGIEKNLQKYMLDRKGNYRNLTEADKQVLLKTMNATLKQKRTGQEISRFDFRKMRSTLWGEKKSGTISGGVYNQYKNFIDKLKGK